MEPNPSSKVTRNYQASHNSVRSVNDTYIQDAHKSALDSEDFVSTYRAARRIFLDTGLTAEDILTLSDKFWDAHMAGSCVVDTAAATIATIHGNLCMGTIVPHAAKQMDLLPLLARLERFEVCGDFMLTEVGHGLDARNIETTATLSKDGKSLDLHTPSLAAAKSMPPTTPLGGIPKVAVVFAQLVIDGKMHGVRTFVVHLTDGTRMRPGISTVLLPQRPGNRALDHAITRFTHVRLNRADLLGEIDSTGNERQFFLSQIHRVSVGGLALSLANIPASRAAAYLCYSFSKHRKVIDPNTNLSVPVLSFPTQYGPIISAAAHAAVMESAGRFFISTFQTEGLPEMLRQALVCIFKATITYTTQHHLSELIDRCGWRGLFAHNKIAEIQLGLKGNSIAEGDVMVLCIRLASELLQSNSPVALYEQGLLSSLRTHLAPTPSPSTTSPQNTNTTAHRSTTFSRNVTPRAVPLIQAIGHRFAYDSALDNDAVRKELLAVWEADVMLSDAGWYVGNTNVTMEDLHARRVEAVGQALPLLEDVIAEWGMERWFGGVPVVGGRVEEEFLRGLPGFEGEVGKGVRSLL
ncbi:acyl-CoA dehydrogenase NM domain-like protein [Plenodomus tracheiphilus IPT5]|uniref:Acyl-CoA dehydrogenase NM domain-like protein n=1 Tax=Plenodomus tracheiphilus IPT5 TaxID=1408161 RepID=A0A6A7ARE5_9PLEO|nr:acyl-CoA dehydrogenase NM domain-like protein [Plenodomus tracheiphilus IPT5]